MSCPICEHKQILVIDAALKAGRFVPVVARQFRVEKGDLVKHLQHAQIPVVPSTHRGIGGVIGLTKKGMTLEAALPQVPTETPFTRFKQAWQDVEDDRYEQQRMVDWLNRQIESDEMGL